MGDSSSVPIDGQPLVAGFFELAEQLSQRYRDLAATNVQLTAERDRQRQIIEGLLGVLGKFVDEDEINRWRAMATIGMVPR